jgi:multiple sugar transport system substrate-binding protein
MKSTTRIIRATMLGILMMTGVGACAATPAATPQATESPTSAPQVTQAPADTAQPTATAPEATATITTTTAATETITIRWSVWGSTEELASHEAVAKAFMDSHPNIKVEIQHTPWDGYHEKLKTMVAAGDLTALADVIFLGEDYNRYAESGVLEPLDTWIAQSNYDLEDYWPSVVDRSKVNGKIYGLQRDLDLRLLYYNKAMFDKAGVSYPTDQWTWDDWADAAHKMTVIETNGRVTQQGIGMETGKWGMLLAQSNGAYLDDPLNPSTCALDKDSSLNAITFFANLIKDKAAMSPADLKQVGGDAAAFQQGKVAMIIQNASRAPTFNAAAMDYDVAPIPIPKDGSRVNNVGGARFVMNSASTHKAEAWTFLSWLQGKEGGQKIYTERGDMFPILRSVAQSDAFMKLAAKPANRAAFVIEASNVRLFSFGNFPEYSELNDLVIEPNLQKIWSGEADAKATVKDTCTKVNEFLKQNSYPKP